MKNSDGSKWTPLPFGKHFGETLPCVAMTDPKWFLWACEEDIFRDQLNDEANDILDKISRIRLPGRDGEGSVMYAYHTARGRLARLELAPPDCYPPCTAIGPYPVLNFEFLASGCRNEAGSKILLREVRRILFGSRRVTVQMYEDFFDNADNFVQQKGF